MFGASICFAGTTGKIAGTVIDSDSHAPLPGANIMIAGTSMGAASDANGQFVILHVPPGRYTLIASVIGYQKQQIADVQVQIDLTTTVSFRLSQQVLTAETVTIVAERPLVTPDISNSQMNIDARAIETLPVQTVKQVLSLQAGIQQGREGIEIRGGGANQTGFMIDGLSLNDERANIPYAAISMSAVQEIQIQTGGFNAEYGNIRSGLVNVVTREGARDRYHASAIIRYTPAGPKHFGSSVYDRNSYFNRPYLDPAVCWTGTNNGAWDDYLQRQYPQFEGWNAVSQATLQDDDPTNDLSPEAAQRLYLWQHRRNGDIRKPDYVIDAGLGGPVPVIGEQLGDMRFFVSHFREQEMFVYPLSRDHYAESHTQLKLTSDVTTALKLTFTGLYGEIHSVSPYSWKTTPTGRVLRDPAEIVGLLNSSSGASVLYMPGYYSPSSIYRTMVGLKLTHILNERTFYETSLQHIINRYHTFQMAERDTSRVYEPVPGYFVDEAPYGYWGYGAVGVEGMSMGGWMNLGRDKSINTTTRFRFDLTSQVNFRNQIKTGIDITYNDYNIRSSTYSPSMSTWTRSMNYRVFPFRIGLYAQDKLEFQGFIANIGLRLDYYDANTHRYLLDKYDKYFKAGYGNAIEQTVPTEKTKPDWDISPRLGISHPITVNSKLYFNYGHFRSEPASSYRFRLQRESNGLVTSIGDPGLALEKTVAYELGFTQNIRNTLLLNLAAYYKDVTNQPGWINYRSIDNSVQYARAANNNYADIRGFEVTLTKQTGRWITGFINYTYDVRTSGYFDLTYYYENPTEQRNYLRLNPYQSRPQPRPFARMSLDIHTPVDIGPAIGQLHPLANWNVNLLGEWRTGRYETFNPNSIPGVVDNIQWKDYYNLDMRIARLFQPGKYEVQLYIDISNVFNYKYMTAGRFNYRSYAGFADARDYNAYLTSLNFSWETGVEHGNDRPGDYRPLDVPYDPLEPNPDNDPAIRERNERRKETKSYIDNPNITSLMFLNPRAVTFGVRISF